MVGRVFTVLMWIGAIGGTAIIGAMIVWARRFKRLPPGEIDDIRRRSAELYGGPNPTDGTGFPL